MQPETLTPVALILVPLAMLMAVLAAATLLLSARLRRGLRDTTALMRAQEVRLLAGLVEARARIRDATAQLVRLGAEERRLGAHLERLIDAASGVRAHLDHLTRRRVRPLVHTLRVAGALARVAMLWRAPAR